MSTLKLVDGVDEQTVLEELLETAKPPRLDEPATAGLHYLLATPFRYPPLRYGSRFGRRRERGLWYGSLAETTVMAEVAYYRFLFLEGSRGSFGVVTTEHTLFRAAIATDRGVDLVRDPFAAWRAQIASPTSYAVSQPLGSAMRDDGIDAFVFPSARDPEGGENVAAVAPAAFSRRSPLPRFLSTWRCSARAREVAFDRLDSLRPHRLVWARGTFEVRGRLPHPGV